MGDQFPGWDFHPNNKEANRKRLEGLGEEEKRELYQRGFDVLAKKHILPPPKPDAISKDCAVCGKADGKLCSACHTVAYCGKVGRREPFADRCQPPPLLTTSPQRVRPQP